MDEDRIARESLQLIKKDLHLDEELEFEGSEAPIDRLRDYLVFQLQYLINTDFERLINALYRIDLSENVVNKILTTSPSDRMAVDLAEAIIDRTSQKIVTRERYRQT